jgi:Zn-dependent protease
MTSLLYLSGMFSNVTGVQLVIMFVSILISMGIHEAMHAFTAHWLGDPTAKDLGRLSLNPFKHIDVFTTLLLPMVLVILGLPPFFIAKPVPFNPENVKYEEFGAALIGFAGPLTNFTLAFIAAMVVRVSGIAVGTEIYAAFSIFILVNLSFFVFNMIPFPPLDGSRVLYAFAPEPLQRVMYKIESGGLTSIIIFMLLLYPFAGPVVGNSIDFLYRLLLG